MLGPSFPSQAELLMLLTPFADTQNYATCWMYLYYGVTYTISMCSYGSGSGDTYIRLYDSTNTVLLASNDDSCGLVSAMTYTTPGCGATAQNYALYYLHSGCYSSTSCSGTVAVIGSSGTPCSPTPSNTPTISVTPSYTATTSATATVTATVTLTPSPSVSPTNPPSYFIGPQGSSCADTCANYGLTCNPNIVTGNSPAIFAQLGVSCTADPTSYWAPYQPAYVSDSGNANYTKCQGYTNVPSPASCTASNPSVKRLCQCYPGGHCPAGWTLYADDGTEGGSSCVLATSTNVYWSTAITGCPSGSHLLTLKTSNPAGTFPTFLKTLVSFSSMRYWLGGSQAYGQPYRNVGWSWIDGTNPANLNCGAGNAIGCNLWYAPDPDDGGFSNEADREDYLQSNLNVGGSFSVNDIAAASTPSALLCEYDLPGYGYNRSAQIGNEVFLRGVYLEVGFHSKGSFGTT